MQNFSLELSKKLSELVPDIGEHAYDWVVQEGNNGIGCTEHLHRQIICPAWQVEDVLKNMTAILLARKTIAFTAIHANEIASILYTYPNTAYRKIEEYLWVLFDDHAPVSHDDMVIASAYAMRAIKKQPKDEECTKAHCKCMQTNCSNHHYTDDNKVLK